jgi:competence protein ComEC
VAAVLAGTGAALSAAVLLAGRRRGHRRGDRRRAVAASGAVTITVAVVAAVLSATALQLSARSTGPVPAWIHDRATVELTGRATGDPRAVVAGRFPGPPRVALQVQVEDVALQGRQVRTSLPMLVLATAGSGPGSWSAVSAGDRVRLRGRLASTEPGDASVALVSVRNRPLRIMPGSWPWRLADRVRAGLRTACHGLPPDSAGLLPSLVVGDTSALPAKLQQDLKAAGLTHLTAVSGANVAILVGAVAWLAAAAGAARRTRLAVSGLAVAGFVVLARPSPSVLRAAVMAGVALTGLASARRPQGLPVLAAAVVLLLGSDPWLSRNPGFVLSCVATGGLLLLAPVWADRLARRMPRPAAIALAAPAAAQAACGPVLVLLAPSVSLVAIPANLLAEPAVAPATLLGVGAAGLSQLWPPAAQLVAWVGSLATGWIALVAHRGASVPLANLPWPGGPVGAALLAGLTGVLIVATVRNRPAAGQGASGLTTAGLTSTGLTSAGRTSAEPTATGCTNRAVRPSRPVAVVVALVALLAGWFLLPLAEGVLPGRGIPPGWSLVMCDVGQGDAVVLRSGAQHAVLVDTGPQPGPVDRCLRRLGVRHLDLVVVTHLHADHAFGLPGVLDGRDVAQLWVSPLQEPSGNAEAVRRWAAAGGVRPVVAWAGATGGGGRDGWTVSWRVLEPRLPPASGGDSSAADGTTVNESSVALVMAVQGPGGVVRLLDLGDLETERQDGLIRRLRSGGDTLAGPVDVVKVAHHGSSRQSPSLYASCGARLGLIGVGAGNDYGHPSPSALGMLAAAGIRVARTDTSGDLVVERTPQGLRVTSAGS